MFLLLQKDATVCTRLECEFPGFEGSGFCKAAAPAAEGSPCGDGLVRLKLLHFYIHYTNCYYIIALLIIKKLLTMLYAYLIICIQHFYSSV